MTIRVLIVDDSSFVRDILRDVLQKFSDIEVVGEARDGQEAQDMLEALTPSVVTMDLLMPMVSGSEASESIMRKRPTPIVLLADSDSSEALYRTALEVGAVGSFVKPRGGFDEVSSEELVRIIRQAAKAKPARVCTPASGVEMVDLQLASTKVLGVVASTGGPQTLSKFLGPLSSTLQIPVCLVQHTTNGFSAALVSWLAQECAMEVELAQAGTALRPGVITVAPDEQHFEVIESGIVKLSTGPTVHSLRPSGDLLLASLAKVYGTKSAGLVCTGMGSDGSDGLHQIHLAGGLCLVQEPGSAVLSSMPKSAAKRVPTSKRVDLPKLAEFLNRDLG